MRTSSENSSTAAQTLVSALQVCAGELSPAVAVSLGVEVAKALIPVDSQVENDLEAWLAPASCEELNELVVVGGTEGGPAFATAKRVFVSPSVYSHFSDDALEALVAHEVSHLRSRDTVGNVGISTMLGAVDQVLAEREPEDSLPLLTLRDQLRQAASERSHFQERRADLDALEILEDRGLNPEQCLGGFEEIFQLLDSMHPRDEESATHPCSSSRVLSIQEHLRAQAGDYEMTF